MSEFSIELSVVPELMAIMYCCSCRTKPFKIYLCIDSIMNW